MIVLTDEQRMIRDLVRDFVEQEVVPVAAQLDEQEVFPRDLLTRLAELGILGIMVPPEFEGMGLDTVTYVLVLEELAKGWIALAGTVSVHVMVASLINTVGTDEQRRKYLPRLAKGEEIGAIAMTEPEAGSDLASVRATAKLVDGGYSLSGNKIFITSGGEAGVYVVLFRSGPSRGETCLFLVEEADPGFGFGKKERKMGYGGSVTRELVFEDCVVGIDRRLGESGGGLKLVLQALDGGRIGVGCMAVGLGQAALDAAIAYALNRQQFGRPIASFQGLQFMLADMATRLQAARLLVYDAAQRRDRGLPYRQAASMAKLYASDVTMNLTTDAVQILGGYGYTKEFPVERFMREAKMLQIVEGTNQIQRLIIARELLQGKRGTID